MVEEDKRRVDGEAYHRIEEEHKTLGQGEDTIGDLCKTDLWG